MGTHVALLREPQSNAAKVFVFGERVGAQKMWAWRFFASADTARLPDLQNPDPRSRIIPIRHPDNQENDLFCNGHAPLRDGRMLFVGGWYVPNDPCEMTYLFDPAWFDSTTSPWTQGPTMATDRWYATATSLPDGRILSAGGLARRWHAAFGGLGPDGTTRREYHPLAVAGRYNWGDTTTVPGYAGAPNGWRAPNNAYTAGQYPPPRTDHAFASVLPGKAVLFGGRRVLPGGAETTLGDAWMLESTSEREHVREDSLVSWRLLKQVDGNPAPGVPEAIPPARSRAALVWAGLPSDESGRTSLPAASDSLTCFLFGGRDASGHVLSDLWKATVGKEAWQDGLGLVRSMFWRCVLPDDNANRARFGHAMWFDPGGANQAGAPHARLVVFGGQSGDSTLASDSVYTVGVGGGVAAAWERFLPPGDGFWGRPQARQGHAFAHRWPLTSWDRERRFYVYGGQDARGNLLPKHLNWNEPLDTHVWALLDSSTSSTPAFSWDWLAWSKPAGHWPAARARAAMVYEDEAGRLIVTGGDLNGDGQAGGLTDSLLNFKVGRGYVSGAASYWSVPFMRSLGHPPLPPVSGHAMISYGNGGNWLENSLEAFTPDVTGAQCDAGAPVTGTWQTLTLQDSLSQQPITWYPYLFVLPDGRLFHAGPAQGDRVGERTYRRFFGLQPGGPHHRYWADDPAVYWKDAWAPGSAAMYRPGKVLRAGTHAGTDEAVPGTSIAPTGRTETIDIAAGTMPGWTERIPNPPVHYALAPRVNLNLTVLPTGDVLATGGVTGDLRLSANAPVRRPQLWRVGLGGWNDTLPANDLAWDPKIRNYHSTALLLPDGRVMTAGGEEPNATDRFTVSIYEPPYLFSGDAYARRPVIAGGPEHLRYGEPFTLGIGTGADSSDVDSIRTVALIRPGAVTHGFDQSQRYVPLGFVPRGNPRRLLAWAPPDSLVAPPGEYMLFVTRGRGTSADSLPVPSLAKWVVVEPPAGTQRDSLDATPPRGGAFLQLSRGSSCDTPPNLHLLWDAPADDDTLAFSGRARHYDLRFAPNASPPPFGQWASIATGAPKPAFSGETAVATGLQEEVWYRFALKAVGDNADTSALSNELVAKLTPCGGGSSGGGGGQYEDPHARRAGGLGQRPGAVAPPEENTLLAGVPLGTRARDVLRLTRPPGLSGPLRRAFVRQGEARGLLVDRARLLAVDHAEGTEVAAAAGGGILAGTRGPARSVTDRAGADVTAAATGAAAGPVHADSGEVLALELPAQAEPAPRTLLLELMGGGTDGGGIEVEIEQAGAWQPVATLHPRLDWNAHALALPAGGRVRLAFRGAYALRFAGELLGAGEAVPRSAGLAAAVSNYSGDVFDAARGAVDTSLAMVAGDTLSLLFADLPAPESGTRTWLLEVEGTPVTPRLAQSLAHRRDPRPNTAAPVAFALHPAAPNPARGSVRLAFDLPVRSAVRLEVFDPQGRRVRRLEGTYEPGRPAFEWDLRHAGGVRVAPGIYTYRVSAGRHRAQGKLVVLP